MLVCLQVVPAGGPPAVDTPIAAAYLGQTPTHSSVPPAPVGLRTAPINGVIARRYLTALSETIGPRVAGTPAEAEAAQYIQTTLDDLGYDAHLQPFSFAKPDDMATALQSANVVAVKAGLSSREIIVGAHYDSNGRGRGADDNASGVAVMLEVAAKIKGLQTPFTIRFIAFGAEEYGEIGSHYFVDRLSDSDRQNIVGMINLDGVIVGDAAYAYGDSGSPESIRDWLVKTAQAEGFDLQTRPAKALDWPDGSPCDCTDYSPFQAAGIPFVFFESTDWNLGKQDGLTPVDPQYGEDGKIQHTPYDSIGYIDTNFPGRIDGHLNLYVTLLYDALTQFEAPAAAGG
jgi:hypothetical protein